MPKPPAPPEPPIHAAARRGDIDELERLVALGTDVNMVADLEVDNGPHLRGLTPLMVAARSIDGASVETLRWLLDHGADLGARSEAGETAAYYAAGKGGRWDFHPWRLIADHVDRLAFLLDSGLDPDETNGVGRSLLVEACEAGDPARVRLLLSRGAMLAGYCGPASRSHVDELLDRAAAMAGAPGDRIEELRKILPRGNPEGRVSYTVPLFCAASSGSAECVKAVLQAGADLHERNSDGRVALMFAGSVDVAHALIDAGSDPNERSSDGDDILSVLFRGAACDAGLCGPGRFDVVRALIARGARLDQPGTSFNNTRLYDAAFRHDTEAIAFLLSLGCPANEADDQARTALHGICWQGEYTDSQTNAACEHIIRMLVAAGADVNARDSEGNTPLSEAASGDWGNQTAIRTLLELGADVDGATTEGATPLLKAAWLGDAESVKLLLAAGANPHRTDSEGMTPYMRAVQHMHSWQAINASPPGPLGPGDTEETQRVRHAEALREAEACVAALGACRSK